MICFTCWFNAKSKQMEESVTCANWCADKNLHKAVINSVFLSSTRTDAHVDVTLSYVFTYFHQVFLFCYFPLPSLHIVILSVLLAIKHTHVIEKMWFSNWNWNNGNEVYQIEKCIFELPKGIKRRNLNKNMFQWDVYKSNWMHFEAIWLLFTACVLIVSSK